MGKSSTRNVTAEHEFSKLEHLLTKTAGEVVNCLKVLKTNLAEYDKRNGLLFINTSKSFMRSDIRAAKDMASELRHVADQIAKSDTPSEWEITAARSKINTVSDAMGELKKTARAYDRSDKSKGITGILGNALTSSNNSNNNSHTRGNETSESGLLGSSNTKTESEGSGFGEYSKGSDSEYSSGSGTGLPKASDTVEAVVKRALHDNFSGFSALKHQVLVAEKSLSPSFAERVMDTVSSMTNSLKEEANFAPEGKEKMSMSV
ncbi:hypothetical protein PF005_g22026 [Phytophthora fragariae]|uniref:Uncharacterized protein n=1 Tax=Phytophthora fragariae TaxID=53985 RepID=A0A6A3U7M3_9STRA|nr:hypothetical protein PF003_g700 [Phytophthora fragariae]KAE8927083.1 hypothetical protein PF009_g22747 [Phytophthora fragariae]KAE8984533.1 hypothetical protein PF011_g20744 [Phytophthora fragariae]KAE9083093.1 hypothetical protein PF007_g22045 [Phytophthora fragariae]KAE9119989.1 hypothetical protein PF010_g7649 [Phytophthora fragariae]